MAKPSNLLSKKSSMMSGRHLLVTLLDPVALQIILNLILIMIEGQSLVHTKAVHIQTPRTATPPLRRRKSFSESSSTVNEAGQGIPAKISVDALQQVRKQVAQEQAALLSPVPATPSPVQRGNGSVSFCGSQRPLMVDIKQIQRNPNFHPYTSFKVDIEILEIPRNQWAKDPSLITSPNPSPNQT